MVAIKHKRRVSRVLEEIIALVNGKPRGISIMLLFLQAFMFCALGIYGYLGTFTRYMADDYSTAGILATRGFWGAQQYWWTHWSGRFSFTFFVSFVELFGLRLVPVLPSLIILMWFLGIVWICIPILKILNFEKPIVVSVFIACVVLWATYRIVDDYPQIVFWQTGILTYPISPIAFLFGAGVAIRRAATTSHINLLEMTLWLLLSFFVGGFSETGVILQISLIAALILILLTLQTNKSGMVYLPILLSSLVGSILSLIVIFVAPGNLVRSGGFGRIPSLGDTLLGSLREALFFLPKLVDRYTLVYLFCFVAGVFLVNTFWSEGRSVSNVSLVKVFGASLFIVGTGVWAGILPAYVLRGTVPPERVLLFPFFLVICFTLFLGIFAALLYIRSKTPKLKSASLQWFSLIVLTIIMSISVVPFFASQLQLISPLMEYSRRWDERHQMLVSASKNGEKAVVVEDFGRVPSMRKLRAKLWISGDFETSADYWVNKAAALYYGVDQIIAK